MIQIRTFEDANEFIWFCEKREESEETEKIKKLVPFKITPSYEDVSNGINMLILGTYFERYFSGDKYDIELKAKFGKICEVVVKEED